MRLVALLLTGWMCGCAAGDAATSAVVRDSAGVRIVENDLTVELPRFVIGEDALVEIGAVEGAEPYLLDNVRRARWFDDGAIAVLNGGTNEVRVFDAAGAFVRGYGRRGQGPGEYRWPLDVWQKGDSLVVYDWTIPAGRITFTALDESGVRTIRTDRTPGAPHYFEVFFGPAGVILPMQVGGPQEVDEWSDFSIDYVRIPFDGTAADTVVRVFGGREGLTQFQTSGGMVALTSGPPLFGGRLHTVVHGGRLIAGGSFERRIAIFDATGRWLSDIRWTSAGEPVSHDRLETYIQERIEASRASRASRSDIRKRIEEAVRADTFPHYAELLTDDEGRVWMRSYDLPGGQTLPRWTVFDTAGIAEAVVEMPRGLKLYEIRRDRVLGMRPDSLGVQRVVVLPLTPRPQS